MGKPKPTKTKAVAYLRVSTEKQADSGTSLESQRKQLAAYGDLYDLEIVAWEATPERAPNRCDVLD